MHRGITADIDLDAARGNLIAAIGAAEGAPVIAVVKADAYGHGAPKLASAFLGAGAKALAVAFISEAVELRHSGITSPIIVLFDRTSPKSYLQHNLTPVIHDIIFARALSDVSVEVGLTLDVHVKLDTGMGRMGLENPADVFEIAALPGLRLTGLMSHFSEADLSDRDFIQSQIAEFVDIKAALNARGIMPLCHFANSAATLTLPEARFDAVRPGIALYGCSPFDGNRALPGKFNPVMSLGAPIVTIRRIPRGRPVSYARTFITSRDTLAAVVGAGYADGLPRAASNRAFMLVNGHRAPVIGRVCMDLTVLDITDAGEAPEGSQAVILGRSGNECISASEIALNCDTISYEILLRFGRLARRRYTSGGVTQ